MKYYVASDIHGFFSEFQHALDQAGYFTETEPHKLIILGDLFDRGQEALELQSFILSLMEHDSVILIRGNHEDMYLDLVTIDEGNPLGHHIHNGTYNTAIQLTGFDPTMATIRHYDFAEAAQETPLYQQIIPAMRNYYETRNYVFVHAWIPCIRDKNGYSYYVDWRNASENEWAKSRWYNGIEASTTACEDKTIVCGHWHTSYGHSRLAGNGSEFGDDAIFTPYIGAGIIAIDACTARSGFVNILILDDDEIS